jgi:hypothetical protein
LSYIDFADAWQILNHHRALLPAAIGAHFKQITPRLEPLVGVRNRVAHSRPLEYTDLPNVTALTDRLVETTPELWPQLTATTLRLRDNPVFVLDIELPEAEDPRPNNLPDAEFDETGFLGRAQQVEKIRNLCLRGGHPVITNRRPVPPQGAAGHAA